MSSPDSYYPQAGKRYAGLEKIFGTGCRHLEFGQKVSLTGRTQVNNLFFENSYKRWWDAALPFRVAQADGNLTACRVYSAARLLVNLAIEIRGEL